MMRAMMIMMMMNSTGTTTQVVIFGEIDVRYTREFIMNMIMIPKMMMMMTMTMMKRNNTSERHIPICPSMEQICDSDV